MTWFKWLPDVLTDAYHAAGLSTKVTVHPGWATRGARGRPMTDMLGLVAHHTAETGPFDRIAHYVAVGAPIAPLCHVVSSHDGREVRVVATGRTNHAGKGHASWVGSDGNGNLAGWEAQGHPDVRWLERHLEVQAVGHAAILKHAGLPVSRLLEHYEWAGRRKSDRHTLDPNLWRARVNSLMIAKETPVDAVLLVHPSTGTPDALAALAGVFDRPDQKVGLVCNVDAARAALREGKRVWAIGGAAAALIDGDTDLVGATRLDTLDKVHAQAVKGW